MAPVKRGIGLGLRRGLWWRPRYGGGEIDLVFVPFVSSVVTSSSSMPNSKQRSWNSSSVNSRPSSAKSASRPTEMVGMPRGAATEGRRPRGRGAQAALLWSVRGRWRCMLGLWPAFEDVRGDCGCAGRCVWCVWRGGGGWHAAGGCGRRLCGGWRRRWQLVQGLDQWARPLSNVILSRSVAAITGDSESPNGGSNPSEKTYAFEKGVLGPRGRTADSGDFGRPSGTHLGPSGALWGLLGSRWGLPRACGGPAFLWHVVAGRCGRMCL